MAINKYSLEGRFISRLEYTKNVFGYISLDTIVNGQLNQKRHIKNINIKRIYDIRYLQRKRLPAPDYLKKHAKKDGRK